MHTSVDTKLHSVLIEHAKSPQFPRIRIVTSHPLPIPYRIMSLRVGDKTIEKEKKEQDK